MSLIMLNDLLLLMLLLKIVFTVAFLVALDPRLQ